MADLLTQVRRDIDARLLELRAVLDEVRRLERARDALETADGHRRRPRARKVAAKKRARMSKAESGELDRRVLALLSEDPAQNPAALALLTDTSPASMNSRLKRLVKQGALKKRRRRNSTRYVLSPGAARARE